MFGFKAVLRALVDHLVDQAVVFRLRRAQVVVAFGVTLDFFERLAGALSQDAVQLLASFQDFAGVNFDLSGLALCAAQRLVNHDL